MLANNLTEVACAVRTSCTLAAGSGKLASECMSYSTWGKYVGPTWTRVGTPALEASVQILGSGENDILFLLVYRAD